MADETRVSLAVAYMCLFNGESVGEQNLLLLRLLSIHRIEGALVASDSWETLTVWSVLQS
jgi:hypothetical protein